MQGKHFFLAAAMAVAAGGAMAQAVYKSVGPDGKIVFSDKPPVGDGNKVTVTGTPAPAARAAAALNAAPPAAEAPAATERPSRATAKKALRAEPPVQEPPAQASAPAPARDPAVEKALTIVLGMEDLVAQTENLCMRTLPTSFKRWSAAADGWKQRHAGLLLQQRRVLADMMNAQQRQLVDGVVKAQTQELMTKVAAAPMASRIKWCDKSVDEINQGALDINGKPNVSGPLTAYRFKSS